MSASLSAFIHQCLSEDKYGRQYVSEIEDRIESLNYSQLEGMHKVLTESAKNARIHCWKAANEDILQYVEKWRAIKGEEYRRTKALEAELLRKIREKERNRLREIHAKESVIRQLKVNARRDAEKEIADFELNRKSTYKMELYTLVPQAEEKRDKLFKYAAGIFVIGLILSITVGVLIKQVFVIVVGIGLVVILAFVLVRKGIKAGKVAPYEEDEEAIARSVDIREEELFMKAMNQLRKSDEEHRQRMQLDKEERRQRKAERKEQEMIRLALLAAGDVEDEDDDEEEGLHNEDVQDAPEGGPEGGLVHVVDDKEREEKEGNEDEDGAGKTREEMEALEDDKKTPESGLRPRDLEHKDDESLVDLDDMSSISGSMYLDTGVAEKKMSVFDLNDDLAEAAAGRRPPMTNPRDTPGAESKGPPMANPRDTPGAESKGPPIANPRDTSGAVSKGPPIANPRDTPAVETTKRSADVVSIMVSDFTDKLTMSGQASISICVENCAGEITSDTETDRQNLSGESLFWRFEASKHDNVDRADNTRALHLPGIISAQSAASSVKLQLHTVQDGQQEVQAALTLSSQEVGEALHSAEGDAVSLRILTGVMCRNDVVNICSISVTVSLC